MKTFSIMETQHNLSKVLREVELGNEVGITRRKKLVARISPVEQESVVIPNFEERARKIWDDDWHGSTTDELVAESRGDR